MFFWGSYNFAAPQQSEDAARPPLRYPLYVPPSLPLLVQSGALTSSEAAAAASSVSRDDAVVQTALRAVCAQPPRVVQLACGMKHVVAILELPSTTITTTTTTTTTTSARRVVYGMGSNHHGQLGAHVATYSATLANLRLDDDGLVARDDAVVSVACGARHTLLCTARGSVYASGDNSCGQLGLDAATLRRALAQQQQHRLHGGSNTSKSSSSRGGGGGSSATWATAASSSSASSPAAATACVMQFCAVTQLARIRRVFACQHASFALDDRGRLYSWGEAQYGHLAHNSRGERVSVQTLKTVHDPVTQPQLVRWFERHRVTLRDVAVGKSHLVCQSDDDEVYTCGEGAFGKLGHGDVTARLEPTRVVFAERTHAERLRGIAAGDDHTLVLKDSSVLGSIVYYFGKLSNGDGQLRPLVVPIPGATGLLDDHSSVSVSGSSSSLVGAGAGDGRTLRCVAAGRGNFSLCVRGDGRLYVWGKHAYSKQHSGCGAAASRTTPHVVEVLERYDVDCVAVGGTFVVASASRLRDTTATTTTDATTATMTTTDAERDDAATPLLLPRDAHAWDVVVSHDVRVNVRGDGDDDDTYEAAVQAFLRQYLGEGLGAAYVAGMATAAPRTRAARYAFARAGAHALARGCKVRVWMTDVYALGTVQSLLPPSSSSSSAAVGNNDKCNNNDNDVVDDNKRPRVQVLDNDNNNDDDDEESSLPAARTRRTDTATAGAACGQRVRLQWERDDWHDEELTLYSSDETLDEDNANRWQPFWFERDEEGNYVAK